MKPIRLVPSPTRFRALNIFLGAMLLLGSIFLLLALATWNPADPSLNTATAPLLPAAIHNWIGPAGSYSADLLFQIFGITAFAFPFWIGGLGSRWISSRTGRPAWLRAIGILLTLAFLPTLLTLNLWHWLWRHALPVGGGIIGPLFSDLLIRYLNVRGTALLAAAFAALGLYLGSNFSFRTAWEWLQRSLLQAGALADRYRDWADARAEHKAEAAAIAAYSRESRGEEPLPSPGVFARLFRRRREDEDESGIPPLPPASAAANPSDPTRPSIWERRSATTPAGEAALVPPPAPSPQPNVPISARPAADSLAPHPSSVPPAPAPAAPLAPIAPIPPPTWQPLPPAPAPAPAPKPAPRPAAQRPPEPEPDLAIAERADADLRTTTVTAKSVHGFRLPPSTLLTRGEEPLAIREDQLREEARTLVEKCAEFKVNGQVVQINPGPMVTTYEFKPDASVKYSRVAGLGDDLCLAMRAESILIERMAGKSTIGIQVPNHERETIHLRDVIESETFTKAKSRLTLAMGKDINGRIVVADLAGMPHVLIAGSTGSGKSVAINAMIMSLLFRTTPAQVRLILVDPKRVELGMYEGIPHLFTPIITEAKLAANALRNAVREMERRLKLLASRSVRNIDQYNAKITENPIANLFNGDDEEQPLPYIVIIIDELADLMMLDRANVEESITRLAQMARAVGIHLILATQRPSVDVITGLIKANVPTRISFRLASKVDSRTIIDDNGAESLLGRGDMLFRPPGTSRLARLHAPYVSETETAAVVDFWKAQGEAEYAEGFLDAPREERKEMEGDGSAEGDNDELFDDAVRLVFEFGKASTSLLQRRLRIGYGRAAHLIDLMERDGLVGPADGSRPRELLKSPGWLHEVPPADD